MGGGDTEGAEAEANDTNGEKLCGCCCADEDEDEDVTEEREEEEVEESGAEPEACEGVLADVCVGVVFVGSGCESIRKRLDASLIREKPTQKA